MRAAGEDKKMKRYAIYFKLQPGKKEEYAYMHAHIWPEMSKALDLAGYRNYSIWNRGDELFAYFEIKDLEAANNFLAGQEIYKKWRDEMEKYVYIEPGTGKKEWFMDELFYHE